MKIILVIPWGPSASTGEGLEIQGAAQTGIIYLRNLSWVAFPEPCLAFPLLSLAAL